MSDHIIKEDFLFLLNETFDKGEDLLFIPTGNGMKPMLNGTTDSVVLTKKNESINLYDVVLYIRPADGSLVLHRVIKVNDDNSYVISGDSFDVCDNQIIYDDIIAVMKSFKHKNTTYTLDSRIYKMYIKIIRIKNYFRNLKNKKS